MRIFVTGASGWVGAELVSQLLDRGHEVLGLARSDTAAQVVAGLGAEVLRGSLEEPALLAEAAARCDGVAHLAFDHDFSRYDEANALDRAAIAAMGEAMAGTAKALVVASGLTETPGRLSTEADPPIPGFPRTPASDLTLELAERGVRSCVLRLPPTVHGPGDHGFMAWIAAVAREQGQALYPGDGGNHWAAVHRQDAGLLCALALESVEPGTVLQASGEEAITTKAIAEALGARFGVPAISVSPEECLERLGFVGMVFGRDVGASSAITQQLLGWNPTGPGLLEDIASGCYDA